MLLAGSSSWSAVYANDVNNDDLPLSESIPRSSRLGVQCPRTSFDEYTTPSTPAIFGALSTVQRPTRLAESTTPPSRVANRPHSEATMVEAAFQARRDAAWSIM